MYFWYLTLLAILFAGLIGYKIACNDLVQQNFTERKLTLCIAQEIVVIIAELVIWLTVGDFRLKFIPLAVWLLCGVFYGCLYLHRRKTAQCSNVSPDVELGETALRTITDICIAEWVALLVCLIMSSFATVSSALQVTSADLAICQGLLLGIGAGLILVLAAYIRFTCTHGSSKATLTKAQLKFHQKFHAPSRF